MDMLPAIIGATAVAAWLYLLLARGWFWREAHKCSTWSNCGKRGYRHITEENFSGAVPEWESVVAVIPARNEAQTIGRSVTSLINQDYNGRIDVIVIDDGSDDGTAEVARAAAVPTHICQTQPEVGRRQIMVIPGKPLPAEWTGKLWAVQQGIETARALNPDFLLLTDADVVHAPQNVAVLVEIAEHGRYALASLMVKLHCRSAAERLLIPAFVFFFFMLYPPRWIADTHRRTAGAAGGCMLVRPEALERAGGMAAIRGEVIDDCALARAMKRAGGRVWLALSTDTASVREYGSVAEIGRMIARTAFSQLHHSRLMLASALVGLAITFMAPMVLLFSGPPSTGRGQMWGTMLGAVAWALMTLAYLPMVRSYRINPVWAASLPLAACFYMGATVWSAVQYWRGRGGEWKDRVQDV